MNQMRFFCQRENCAHHIDTYMTNFKAGISTDKIGLSYEKALEHLKTCQFIAQPCEDGCGQMLLTSQIEAHKEKCFNKKLFCESCELVFYPNRPGSVDFATHNCIEELSKRYH